MTRLPSLFYAKAVLQTYRLLFPDIVRGIKKEELEEFMRSQYESLVTQFIERNFDIIPQEVRATLELSLYEIERNGIKKEGIELIRKLCNLDDSCILSGRECINLIQAEICEKKIDGMFLSFLEPKPKVARVVS